MKRFAAVSLLVVGAQAQTAPPTASPTGECPIPFAITTFAPTAAPSRSPTGHPTKSPSSPPTYHPTFSPTAGPVAPVTPPPFVPAPPTTARPHQVQNYGVVQPAWGEAGFNGLCRCDILGEETMPFLDRNDSYCGNKAGLLAAWGGAVHFTCPHCVSSGTSINITCPNDWETCEILVNLYVCPGCSSANGQTTHGNWPASLSTDGWTAASRCTASFCSDAGQHPFVGFQKSIRAGEVEMLPEVTSEPTMYFSILVKAGRVCDALNEMDCGAETFCHWSSANGGECVHEWCPQIPNNANTPASCGPCAPGTPDGTCQAQ